MQLKRVDQILSSYGYCSRREAPRWIRRRRVQTREGELITSPSQKQDPHNLLIDNEPIEGPDGILVMVHKPLGVVCSHAPREGLTIFDLLPQQWMMRKPKPSSVGRLDKETTGLVLVTDNGSLIHQWTSPRHKVPKVYRVDVDKRLDPNLTDMFAAGTLQLKGEDKPCLSAELVIESDQRASLTLYEGRFHQVRRMFHAVGYEVTALHRSQFGSYGLGSLAVGEFCVLPMPE